MCTIRDSLLHQTSPREKNNIAEDQPSDTTQSLQSVFSIDTATIADKENILQIRETAYGVASNFFLQKRIDQYLQDKDQHLSYVIREETGKIIGCRFTRKQFKLYTKGSAYSFEDGINTPHQFQQKYKNYGGLIGIVMDPSYKGKGVGTIFHRETTKKLIRQNPSLEGVCFTYSTNNLEVYNPQTNFNLYEDKRGRKRIGSYTSHVTKHLKKIVDPKIIVMKTREEILGNTEHKK